MVTRKKLTTAAALTAAILIFEVAGSIYSGSLALLADAGHVFMDVFALGLSLLALKLADVPPDDRRTYGWHRAEVFAAFINGCALLAISGLIIWKAAGRITSPPEVRSVSMFLVALAGLAVNVFVAGQLREHDKHDINVRSAYLHVLGDMLGSVAVVASALVIRFTGFSVIDPVLSILISCMILYGAAGILKEAVNILFEGVPSWIDLKELAASISGVKGVRNPHDLHLWSVCAHTVMLSCHVETECVDAGERTAIICGLKKMLADKYGIRYTTIEVEEEACAKDLVSKAFCHMEKR